MAKAIVLFLFLFSHFLFAQEVYEMDKVVVGSKRQMTSGEIVTGVDSLEGFEGQSQGKVIEEIANLPGVSITQSGAPGQQSAIIIRGGEARHTLVIIDGVRMNDPSNTEKFFNASLLNLGDIEKIEVLKGSQTLLYGSEAIAGVVNIVTKKGSGKNWIAASSGFSRGVTIDNTAIFKKGAIHLNAYIEKSEGVSAATRGEEEDGFENKGVTLNLSLELPFQWEGDWTYKSLNQFVETDSVNSEGVPVDSLNDYSKSHQQIFSQKLNRKYKNWQFEYLLGANKVDRRNKASDVVYNFSGLEVNNELHWTKKTESQDFLLGLENNSESFEQSGIDSKFAGMTSAVFIGDTFIGDYGMHYGLRAAYHTQYDEVFSPALGASKRVGDSRVGINYQRGLKSPTLYQLYGPDIGNFKVGNTELEPEISDYIEISNKSKRIEASIFYNKIDRFIQYDTSSGYVNSSWLETIGAEVSIAKKWGKHTLRPGVFFAKYELSAKEKALRKPAEKVNINYEYDISSNQVFSANYVWRGASYDNVNGALETLDAFDTLDISYRIVDGAKASARVFVENVFDRSYETAFGYSNQPFTFGLELKRFY